jgi:hypothetical protein
VSAELLSYLPNLHLTITGDWAAEKYVRPENRSTQIKQQRRDVAYETARRETQFASDRRRLYCVPSTNAIDHFEDQSLDFVLLNQIDNRRIRQQILHWKSKLKPNGLLCGQSMTAKKPCGKASALAKKWGVRFVRHTDGSWSAEMG